VRALARIDAGAIARNTARLARAADGAAVCAVVKSDGYGHGAVTASQSGFNMRDLYSQLHTYQCAGDR